MTFYPAIPLLSTAGGTITGALTVAGLLTTQLGISNSGASVASSAGLQTTALSTITAGGNINASLGSISGLALNTISSAPGMAAGGNAGAGPPAPVPGGSSGNSAGSGTFGTGTGPTAGAMVVVTFATAFSNVPFVTITPGNTATQALGLFFSAAGTGGFTVSCTTAPAASQGAATYQFSYTAIG